MKLSEVLKNDLTPQARKVLDHMQNTGSISNVEAHAVHRVRSLSRRITEIGDALYFRANDERVKGHFVEKLQRRDVTGQRYVRYQLVKR